jgi:hypothetical protein
LSLNKVQAICDAFFDQLNDQSISIAGKTSVLFNSALAYKCYNTKLHISIYTAVMYAAYLHSVHGKRFIIW